MFMLNFTYFLLNRYLKKINFELQVGFNFKTFFQSYASFKANDETYSSDKLTPLLLAIIVDWLTSRHTKKGFDTGFICPNLF